MSSIDDYFRRVSSTYMCLLELFCNSLTVRPLNRYGCRLVFRNDTVCGPLTLFRLFLRILEELIFYLQYFQWKQIFDKKMINCNQRCSF